MALTLGAKKTAAAVAAAALTLGAGAVVAAPAASAAPGGWYNIRSGPGVGYPVVGKMYNPNCNNYAGDFSPNSAVRAGGHVWNPVHAHGARGWAINDGWCI